MLKTAVRGFAGMFVGLFAVAGASGGDQYLLVTDAAEDTVRKYSLDGTYLGTVFESGAGGVDQPLGITLGADGSLLVSGDLSRKVHRFDLDTGAFLGDFATHPSMVGPAGMTSRDGNLYVSDGRTGSVLRFDSMTGAYVDTFITGMAVPEAVMFEADGDVIVGDWLRSEFREYDGETGEFKRFVVRGNGLERPLHAELSADGSSIFSVNLFGNTLTEHDVATGGLLRTVDLTANGSPLNGPVDWVELSDGTFVVSSTLTGQLLRYNSDWEYEGVFAEGNATRAGAIVLVPAPGAAGSAAIVGVGAAVRRRR